MRALTVLPEIGDDGLPSADGTVVLTETRTVAVGIPHVGILHLRRNERGNDAPDRAADKALVQVIALAECCKCLFVLCEHGDDEFFLAALRRGFSTAR